MLAAMALGEELGRIAERAAAFAEAMKAAVGAVEQLARDVEARYKRELR